MAAINHKILLLLIVCILSVFITSRALLIRPRFIYQQGISNLRSENYDKAIVFFQNAENSMPEFFKNSELTEADRFYRCTHHGVALYQVALHEWKKSGLSHQVYDKFISARSFLLEATSLEKRDYLTAHWLARTEHVLERIQPWRFPGSSNPYNADPLYTIASSLRPAGFSVRLGHARYLHEKKMDDRLPELIQNITEIYPPIFDELKKEPYFTKDLIIHMELGLKNAVRNDIRARKALSTLSRLYSEQDNMVEAIHFYQKFLAHDPKANTYGDYMRLGILYLQDSQYEKAHAAFIRTIRESSDPGETIRRIYRFFHSEKKYIQFLSFVDLIEKKGIKINGVDIVVVRCCLDMGNPFLAKEKLMQSLAKTPTGQAWYMLAQMAEKEKKWDQMEVAAQKATRLDPYNHRHHYLFARALNIRKKYANAEAALTQAIRHYPGESANYYNFRANTRWNQQNYLGAARDWEKAATIKPDNPDFSQRAAQARDKIDSDLDSYLKAKYK